MWQIFGMLWTVCSVLSLGIGVGLCFGGHPTVGSSMITGGASGLVGALLGFGAGADS